MPIAYMKFNYIAHDNQSKSMKNSDQVSCPPSTGKEKYMDEINWSSDFYSDIFSLGFDKNVFSFKKKKGSSCGRASTFR